MAPHQDSVNWNFWYLLLTTGPVPRWVRRSGGVRRCWKLARGTDGTIGWAWSRWAGWRNPELAERTQIPAFAGDWMGKSPGADGQDVVEVGLRAVQPAAEPVATDEGIDEVAFDEVSGRSWSWYSLARRSRSAWFSPGMMVWRASMPCWRALKRDASLPAGVRGPVDFWALRRLASNWFRVAMSRSE